MGQILFAGQVCLPGQGLGRLGQDESAAGDLKAKVQRRFRVQAVPDILDSGVDDSAELDPGLLGF